jgi:hypothetical protein
MAVGFYHILMHICNPIEKWPRSTMDSMRVSEAPDPGSIPGEATNFPEKCGFYRTFFLLRVLVELSVSTNIYSKNKYIDLFSR